MCRYEKDIFPCHCREVFEEFKQYCLTETDRNDETDNPLQAVKILNEEVPDGIPKRKKKW